MSRLVSCSILILALSVSASAQLPVFVTQTPTTGNSGTSFFVFLPVANTGTGAATNMQLTSVTLNHLGAPATATLVPATVPFVTGSGYLGPTGVRNLDLEFDNSKLVSGNTYLLTVRGTYQAGGTTLGFSLNRPVVYAKGFIGTHQQLINAILAKFQSRPRLDPQADDQAMVAFLGGLPQVGAADLQADPPVVSVTFNDGGEPLTLLNNVKLPAQPVLSNPVLPGPGTALSSVGLLSSALANPNIAGPAVGVIPGMELPTSRQVRVLNALGNGFPTAASDVNSWLTANGFVGAPGGSATEQGLRDVGGEGVFYFSTHAGASGNHFFLWTASLWEVACEPSNLSKDFCSDPTLTADIADHLVTNVAADNLFDAGIRDWRSEAHFGINAEFIDAYWHDFENNAFVYLDACDTELSDARAQAFRNTVFTKGASVLAGWTGQVGDVQVDTAKLVVDRLLGANQFCPEDGLPCHTGQASPPIFAQRPFNYSAVEVDLPLHKLGSDGFASQLRFEPNPLAPGFGLLAPSISNTTMDETMGQGGQLTINGVFGQDPRPNGSVQVGGTDAPIASWDPNKIVVNLNLSGAGSSGDVQVKVRGHKSNLARLTDWRSNSFIFTYKENGSLQIQTTYNMHFRADVRKYRKMIHFEPDEPSGAIQSANDSTATFIANGSGPGTSETFSLKGSGALVNVLMPSAVSDNIFGLAGLIGDSKSMTFDFVAASSHGCTCTVCNVGGCHDKAMGVFGPSNTPNFSLLVPSFRFVLDESATIQKNALDLTNLLPLCNTDIKVATGQLKWGSISAGDTAPDPQSAR